MIYMLYLSFAIYFFIDGHHCNKLYFHLPFYFGNTVQYGIFAFFRFCFEWSKKKLFSSILPVVVSWFVRHFWGTFDPNFKKGELKPLRVKQKVGSIREPLPPSLDNFISDLMVD